MNLTDLAKGVKGYCQIRIAAGAISAACIAVILLLIAFMLPSWMGDTSKYVSVNGTVESWSYSSRVRKGDTGVTVLGKTLYAPSSSFDTKFTVSYEVNGKTYTVIQTESGKKETHVGQIRKVTYDPANPAKTASSVNIENKLSWVSVACAVVIAGLAVFSYMFRDNPFFCGGTILSDTVSIFSST